MCRTCGARPSVSALRCSTPKRCCSSITATASRGSSTPSWISACVPTTMSASRLALDRAGEQRDANAERRAQRLEREEVLLGERLGRRHQRARGGRSRLHATARTARRPSCPSRRRPASSRCIGIVRARSASISRDRPLLMLGERERQRLAVARDQLARHAERRRDRDLARLRRRARVPSWRTSNSSNASRARATLGLGERCADGAARERVASRRQALAFLERGGQRVGDVARQRERARARAASSASRPRSRDRRARSRLSPCLRRRSCDGPRSAAARPVRRRRSSAPADAGSATHGWLNHVAWICRVVGDRRLDDRRRRPRGIRSARVADVPSIDTSSSSPKRLEIGRRAEGSGIRRVLEQVAHGAQAELREPRADRLADSRQRVDADDRDRRARHPDGRGQAAGGSRLANPRETGRYRARGQALSEYRTRARTALA